ncbi:MAG: RNA polymerase sigma factor [Candidatus Zixiibacteriota bacterium]
MKNENSDPQDWQAFCQGDNSAMVRLYTRHSPAIFSYCLYLSGNRTQSEDIVQEAFLKLMATGQNGRAVQSVRAWLIVTARNMVLNHATRNREVAIEGLSDAVFASQSDTELAMTVKRLLEGLNMDDRELFLLREHQGFSIREISQMLALSEENVRVRLFRIRKQMREQVRR